MYIFLQFYACILKLQQFKKIAIFFLQFLGNVTIDANGKMTFSKIGKILNCGIRKVQSRILILIAQLVHLSFSSTTITK